MNRSLVRLCLSLSLLFLSVSVSVSVCPHVSLVSAQQAEVNSMVSGIENGLSGAAAAASTAVAEVMGAASTGIAFLSTAPAVPEVNSSSSGVVDSTTGTGTTVPVPAVEEEKDDNEDDTATATVDSVCPAITHSHVVESTSAESLTIQFTSTTANRTVEWVDVHVSVNAELVPASASVDAPQFNYRMVKSTSDAKQFTLTFPPTGQNDTLLKDYKYINFFFTYGSEMVDCDTEVYNYQRVQQEPDQGENVIGEVKSICPYINFTQSSTWAEPVKDVFSISFYSTTPDVNVEWVDVHATITSATVNGQYNYRMMKSTVVVDPMPGSNETEPLKANAPDAVFYYSFPGVDGISVPQDASVTYFFTYCADMVDCNTDMYTVSRTPDQGGLVDDGAVCPAIEFIAEFEHSERQNNNNTAAEEEQGEFTVTFTSTTLDRTVEWVDLHVSINTALLEDGKGAYSPQYNYRMKRADNESNSNSSSPSLSFTYTFPGIDGVRVPRASYVGYFFTYCSEMTDCNTPKATFGGAAAVEEVSRVRRDTVITADDNDGDKDTDFVLAARNGASAAQTSAVGTMAIIAVLSAVVQVMA